MTVISDKDLRTRDALIKAAALLLAEVGYAGATTTRIAVRAGLSRGALQYHFRSKDEIMVAVADYIADGVDLPDLGNAPSSLEARVDWCISYYRTFTLTKRYIAAVKLIYGLDPESAVYAEVMSIMKRLSSRGQLVMKELFYDVALDGEEFAALPRALAGHLYGCQVYRDIMSIDSKWADVDTGLLRDMLMAFVSARKKPRPPGGPAKRRAPKASPG